MTNYTDVAIGYMRTRSSSGNGPVRLESLKITETVTDVTTEDYTINYKYNDLTIKTVLGTEAIGATVNAESPITIEGQKYYATDGTTTSMTISAGATNNILNVDLRKAATYTFDITAKNNGNVFATLYDDIICVEDETVSKTIPAFVLSGTTLYGKGGENFTVNCTPTSNNDVEVNYPNIINDVVAFIEGEDCAGATAKTPGVYTNLASMGRIATGTNLPVADLTAGVYNLYLHYINTNASAHAVTIKAGEDVVKDFSLSARPTVETGNFIVTDQASITFTAPGSSTSGVDYIYIVKTGDYQINKTSSVELQGYKTFYDANVSYEVDANTKIYKAETFTSGDTEVTLTEVDADKIIPAGTPVIIKNATAPYQMTLTATVADSSNDFDGNALAAATGGETGKYILAYTTAEGLAFYQYTPALAAGDVYLNVTAAGKAIRIKTGETTGIENVASAKATNKAVKRIMNGQLVIEKAGKMFNAAGAEMK